MSRRRCASPSPRAAASLASYTLQRLDGKQLAAPRDPLNSLFETRDGRWIQLLGLFGHLTDGTSTVLKAAPERSAIAAAVSRWDAFELEDTLADAGMVGAVARSAQEWRDHPQGVALLGSVPVEVVKLAEGDPEPCGHGDRPLGGVRVLDLTRILAGPVHGKILAEHGADVLLVTAASLPNVKTCIVDTGPGKLATFIDLDNKAGRMTMRTLAAHADVFVQNYRSGALERRGFGPAELVAQRPGLIYVTINTYGDVGPWRQRPGWEPLAEAAVGLAVAEGVGGPPQPLPVPACDYATGYLAALGTMAALLRRAREGGSYLVRASLCQTAMWLASLGARCDPAAHTGFGETREWMQETDTAFGRLTHLAPVAQLSVSPNGWSRPVVPLGTHAPRWPPLPGARSGI